MNSDQSMGFSGRRAPWTCFRLGSLTMIHILGQDKTRGRRAHAPRPQPLPHSLPHVPRVGIRTKRQLPLRTSKRPQEVLVQAGTSHYNAGAEWLLRPVCCIHCSRMRASSVA
jgi:hypothetical protein